MITGHYRVKLDWLNTEKSIKRQVVDFGSIRSWRHILIKPSKRCRLGAAGVHADAAGVETEMNLNLANN